MIEIGIFIVIFVIFSYIREQVSIKGSHLNHSKLPDILHNEDYNLKSIPYVNDFIVFVLFGVTLYYILKKQIPIEDTVLFFRYLGICILIKSIMMSSTILPDASGKCFINKKTNFEKSFTSGCNDLVFSMHLTITLLLLHFLKKYHLISNITTIILSILEALLICFSHNHYTIDVLVSFLVVPMVVNNNYMFI